VVLVGKSSIHREKVSIRTRIYSYPWSPFSSGPMWPQWMTSKGLYDVQLADELNYHPV
jgi:hypothetical protein